MSFLNIEYLKEGNIRQRSAYETLVTLQIFDKLIDYNPILAGTIPINIDIETSDLDVICYWKDKTQFSLTLTALFKLQTEFRIRDGEIGGEAFVVCNFKTAAFEIEIFGQSIPSEQQNAYRHMLIEYQILRERGEDFRLNIIELKRKGYKTEPAFAKLLNLSGNPYEALLNYTL